MSEPGPDRSPEGRKLSAVIACYRDAPAVPHMHRRLVATFRRIGVDYEIIFVNDCSPDNAAEVLAELAAEDDRVTVINHSRNFGSQSAFTSGLRIASGDAVALLDGDLQDPPEIIADFYERWLSGYDVIYGVRVKRETSALLRVAYPAFYRLFRATSYVPVPLDAGDFSLIDRRVVGAINSLPENNRLIRGLRAWVGFAQTGVEYVRPDRPFGESTNNLRKNLGWARKAIFSFSFMPFDLITVVALMISGAALLLATVLIIVRFIAPASIPSGFTTLIVLMLFLGGVQLFCLSIIGGYLAHIYEEVKHRPPFIVESILNPPGEREADDR